MVDYSWIITHSLRRSLLSSQSTTIWWLTLQFTMIWQINLKGWHITPSHTFSSVNVFMVHYELRAVYNTVWPGIDGASGKMAFLVWKSRRDNIFSKCIIEFVLFLMFLLPGKQYWAMCEILALNTYDKGTLLVGPLLQFCVCTKSCNSQPCRFKIA